MALIPEHCVIINSYTTSVSTNKRVINYYYIQLVIMANHKCMVSNINKLVN